MSAVSGVLSEAQSATPEDRVSLAFHPHVSVWLIMIAIAAFLWWAFTSVGPRLVLPGEAVITRRQRNWMIAGLLSTWVWAEYPLHDISERYLFLVHMLQHTVFTLVAPACFLLGAPPWMWRWLLSKRPIHLAARFFGRPIIALLTFNTLIVATHWPKVVNTSTTNEPFHFAVHTVLFVSALCMWFPVINREPGYTKFKTPTKMVYLFAQSIAPTVPASFLTFSETAMYDTYRKAPRMIHGLTDVGDQQIAAAIMKIGGGSLLWGIVGYLFVTWWKESQAGRANDNIRAARPTYRSATGVRTLASDHNAPVLTWADVEVELTSHRGSQIAAATVDADSAST